MHRTLGALVTPSITAGVLAVAVAVTGCGGAKLRVATSVGAKAAADATDACASSSSSTTEPVVSDPSPIVPNVEPPWGERIARVDVAGTAHIPRELVMQTIRLREGSTLESDAVARDVRALYDLEAIETVRVDVERKLEGQSGSGSGSGLGQGVQSGVVVRYEIQERRAVGNVTYRSPFPLAAGHWVPLAKGELYDPVRIARMRIDLERNLASEGHLHAKVEERHKAISTDRVDVCFVVDPGPKLVIDRIAFVGNAAIAQGELAALIQTHDDRVNSPGKPYRDDLLEHDLLFVSALYYDRGYVSVNVGPPHTTLGGTLDNTLGHITVEIPISEGPMYRIRSIRFSDAATKSGLAVEYKKRFGVKTGDVFNRTKVAEGLEKIRELHRSRGEDVDVSPGTELDTPNAQLDLMIDVKTIKTTKPKSPLPPPKRSGVSQK